MKPEIERMKSDLETMRQAMGTEPAFGQGWAKWLRRDNRLNLWWLLPAAILIGTACVHWQHTQKYWGLLPEQWVGLLVAAVMIGMLVFWHRTVTRPGGRPDGLVREYKRINTLSWWSLIPFLIQIILYLAWANQHGITGNTVMSGLWLVASFSLMTAAMVSKLWMYLGWALPMVAYAFLMPAVPRVWGGLALGIVFVVGALLSWLITSWQITSWQEQSLEQEAKTDVTH